ncbi:MAG: 4Fe-4S dicluster domain-containing protein [Chloroflexi bacterium]|nr:MAG: 4Fe-4S dicluster domain-containing protein [Chloroflexota bacterium]
MKSGLQARLERLFNRHGDGRAICVAADHGYMSDVTPNVVNLRSITEAVIAGGVDGILLAPGQALRLAPLFQGRSGPALILRADWMNMPRLGTSNVTNAVPQRLLLNEKVITAEQALSLGATAITIYLFLGYSDQIEAIGVDKCAKFVNECRRVGLPCIIEPLAYGGQVTGANIVEILTLGARMAVEIGADALKIPYTGDVDSFRHLIEVSGVPTLVLGGARSDNERDALELYAEAQEAGASGCLMGRNVTKSPNPRALIEQLSSLAHRGWTVDEALRGEAWDFIRLKAKPGLCTGCNLCLNACVASHDSGDYGLNQARLRIEAGNEPGQHKVMFCTLCKKCIDICPTQALRWHPQTGAVELLPERCDNCAKCVDICPTQVILRSETGITFADGHSLDWQPVICDLCGGKPECARICPTGAIFTAERPNFSPVLE